MASGSRTMRRKLPPLSALRTFEAAARTLSFTKAAEELLVTQGAISRQIRLLEEHLGVALFKRLIRKVELTPDGEQYFISVSKALDEVESATGRLRCDGRREVITISVLPTISSFWLM